MLVKNNQLPIQIMKIQNYVSNTVLSSEKFNFIKITMYYILLILCFNTQHLMMTQMLTKILLCHLQIQITMTIIFWKNLIMQSILIIPQLLVCIIQIFVYISRLFIKIFVLCIYLQVRKIIVSLFNKINLKKQPVLQH